MRRLYIAGATLLLGGSIAFGPGFTSAQTEPGWPTFHGNPQRDGIANVNGPTVFTEAARFNLPQATTSTPVVGPDGIAYVGDRDKKVYALDPSKTQQYKWTFATNGAVVASPTLSGDSKTLYVGSEDGYIYALDTATGAKKWQSTWLGGPVRSSPLTSPDGNLVFGENVNGTLMSLQAADGTKVGACLPGGAMPVGLAASPDGGTIYVVAGDAMYAVPVGFTTDCGQALEFYLDGNGTSTPSVDANGYIYVGTSRGYLDSFTPTAPASRWKYQVPGTPAAITSTPTFSNGNAIFGGPNGYLIAVGQQSGSQVWQFRTGSAIGSSPATAKANGLIYFGAEDGNLYAVDSSGAQKAVRNLGTGDESSPALDADNTLWVAAASQVLKIGPVAPPPTLNPTLLPPTNTPAPTPIFTNTPVATSTPTQTPTPTATSTPATIALSITVKGTVKPGQQVKVQVKSAPNTVVRLRVEYPNGDHQSARVTTNAGGTATYKYKQGPSKVTHRKFIATVIAKAGTGAAANSTTATYKIKFGTLDVSAEPRTVAVGKVVDIFVHAQPRSRVIAYLLAPSGKKITLPGTTGPKGLSSSKYKVQKGLTTSKNRKVIVLATFQRGGTSTKTFFTIK